MAWDIYKNKYVDLFRIGQIIEFLSTYLDHCHLEKEEKILFPAILECGIPWTIESINHLSSEHITLREKLREIDNRLTDYLSGRTLTLEKMASSLMNYISLAEKHISFENNVLFPFAEKVLSKKQQEAIYSEFKIIRDCKIGHNKHLEYYILLSKLYSEVKVTYAYDY
jgi:hemerythrin-like domain-containing protein